MNKLLEERKNTDFGRRMRTGTSRVIECIHCDKFDECSLKETVPIPCTDWAYDMRLREPYQVKASEISLEINELYAKCCIELGLNPEIIHDNIEAAPSYSAYYRKCEEFRDCYRNKAK